MSRDHRGDLVEHARASRQHGAEDFGPLFAPGVTEAPAVAVADHATSRDAAEKVAAFAGGLRRRVVELIAAAGPTGMTDLELEALPEFAQYGASPVRKRRSEAKAAGYLQPQGARGGATIWVRTARPLP